MTAEINPNMAISMARQFGITVLHNEPEHLISLFKMWHRTGFENGQAIEREACALLCDQLAQATSDRHDTMAKNRNHKPELYMTGKEVGACGCAAAIRARGTE